MSSIGGLKIAVDNETGGLTDEVSLLTSYLAILDNDLNIIDELELAIKPNNDLYVVSAEALNVNKINLIEHDKVAISESKAGQLLREFLVKHNPDGKNKLIPVGHNVAYDIRGLGRILNPKTINQYVSYRVMDTGVYAQLLRELGLLPQSVKGSLESLVKYYDLPEQGFHTAKGDTLMTVEVLKKQLEQFRGNYVHRV